MISRLPRQPENRLMHGKSVSDEEKREAISRVLHYCDRINDLIAVTKRHGFRPFHADLRGFTGRGDALDKSTSRGSFEEWAFPLTDLAAGLADSLQQLIGSSFGTEVMTIVMTSAIYDNYNGRKWLIVSYLMLLFEWKCEADSL
jgi:predicted alpha/beta-fold hydrolase